MHTRFILLLALSVGCQGTMTPAEVADAGPVGPLEGLMSLSLSPENPQLVVQNDQPASQTFRVMGHFADGSRDVTEHVTLMLDDSSLGSLDKNQFTSVASRGGRTKILATAVTMTAETFVTVKLVKQHIVTTPQNPTGPTNAPSLFASAADGTEKTELLYPPNGVLLPPNLSSLEVMAKAKHADLFEVSLQSQFVDIKLYAEALPVKIDGAVWTALAGSNREGEVSLTVRSMIRSEAKAHKSETRSVAFARDDVKGGLYYWAATSKGGVMRFDFGNPQKKVEQFYSNEKAGGCVACHVVSRDGSKMAVTFDGGDGPAGTLAIKGFAQLAHRNYHANFQVFTPDNKYLIASSKGELTVRDPDAGTQIAVLDTQGKATMPDVSADGKKLVYVSPKTHSLDWQFDVGSLVLADLVDTKLQNQQVLVAGKEGQSNYYPSFGPEGNWVIFNRSSADSYSDDDAMIWVVSKSGGAPVALSRTNMQSGLRNSWARWSPFVQTYKGRKLLWFTFSTTRDYGTRLVNTGREEKKKLPQIWMAAFDPEKATRGEDPSYPAFYLPFQDITTNNHIAQWTEAIVTVD
jgi:hypothetical protein